MFRSLSFFPTSERSGIHRRLLGFKGRPKGVHEAKPARDQAVSGGLLSFLRQVGSSMLVLWWYLDPLGLRKTKMECDKGLSVHNKEPQAHKAELKRYRRTALNKHQQQIEHNMTNQLYSEVRRSTYPKLAAFTLSEPRQSPYDDS